MDAVSESRGLTPQLRLVQLVHGYPPAVGGVEFAVRDLCEGLVRRHGVDVTVLTTTAYTNANFRDRRLPTIPIRSGEVQNGVRVRRFEVVTRWAPVLRVAQGIAWRARLPGNDRLRLWFQGPISPGLRRAAREQAADVVCVGSFPLNHLTYPFQRRDGAPIVLISAIHPWDEWGYDRPVLIQLARRAAATVAFTDSEGAWLLERGVPESRVHVIPLGVAPSAEPADGQSLRRELGIPPEAFVVGYVGQQGSHKGIDTLIAALPQLLDKVPGAWLVVAGSKTPFTATLERLETALPAGTSKQYARLDDVSDGDKRRVLAAADVFASPSAHESFGLTTVEAWREHRAVVVGDGPAQRELLRGGELGELVAHGDAAGLVAALVRQALAPARRRALGEAGHRRFLEAYTLERMVDAYHALFEQLTR